MNRASLAQSNSVQSQFAALTRDRDALRHAMEAVNRDRRNVEKYLQELHESHRKLTEQVRVAQGNLGKVNGQRSLWQEERARLKRQMEQERCALENAILEVEECEKEAKQRQQTFCQETKKLCQNLEHLIRQYELGRLKPYVSTETVEYLCRLWKESQASSDDFHKVESSLSTAANQFKEANEKRAHERDLNDRLHEQVHALRGQVMSSENFEINEQDLLALEDSWKNEQWGHLVNDTYGEENRGQHIGYGPNTSGHNHDSALLDLFYGRENDGINVGATETGHNGNGSTYPGTGAGEDEDMMHQGDGEDHLPENDCENGDRY